MTHVRCRGRNNIVPLLGRGEVQRNKRETTLEYLHAPCMLAFSPIILQRSDEDNAPPVQHERPLLETISFKSSTLNELLRLTEGSKRKSTIPLYCIKIKCQRMVGQCPACPIGRAVAAEKDRASCLVDHLASLFVLPFILLLSMNCYSSY